MTLYTVEAAGVSLPPEKGRYSLPGIIFSAAPTGTLTFLDIDGDVSRALPIGTLLTVKRDGAADFTAIVQNRKRKRGADGETVAASCVGLHHTRLRRRTLAPYVYDEDGLPETTRDAVRVNPWRTIIARAPPGSTIDGDGFTQPLDGLRLDQVMQAFIGAAVLHQADFTDNRWLRPSQVAVAANALQVYQDGPSGDTRPYLQRTRNGAATFIAGGQQVESIPIENSDPNVEAMNPVASVEVLLLGSYDGTNSPVLEVCRNARSGARVYAAVPLTRTANYLGSGMTAWTGSLDVSGLGGDAQNSLGYRFAIPGAQAATTTKVSYLRIFAPLTQAWDGIPYTLTPYYDGQTLSATGPTVWVEDDFAGMKPPVAIERLRKGTIADPALNPSAHWDAWQSEPDGHFWFAPRRGTMSRTVQATDADVEVLEHEEFGEGLAYQTIGLGGGKGDAEVVLVDRTEFSAGGLYDADRDPSGATRLYGDKPAVAIFRDQSIKSKVELRRRCRAFHKRQRDPQVRVKATFIPFPNTSGPGYEVANTLIDTRASINFDGTMGTGASSLSRAQSFTVAQRATLRAGTPIYLMLKWKTSLPAGLATIRIGSDRDAGGLTATLDVGTLTSGYVARAISFSGDFTFEPGVTYYVSMTYSGSGASVCWGGFTTDTYGGGTRSLKDIGTGAWNNATGDMALLLKGLVQVQPGSSGYSPLPDIGDGVEVLDASWPVDAVVRVVDGERAFDGDGGEDITLNFGEEVQDAVTAGRTARVEQERVDAKPTPLISGASVGSPGIYFDGSRFGRQPIVVPEGVEVERCLVSLRTSPWQATAQALAAAPAPVFTGAVRRIFPSGVSVTPTDAAPFFYILESGAGIAPPGLSLGTFMGYLVRCWITSTASSDFTRVGVLEIRNDSNVLMDSVDVTQGSIFSPWIAGPPPEFIAGFSMSRFYPASDVSPLVTPNQPLILKFRGPASGAPASFIIGSGASPADLGFVFAEATPIYSHEHDVLYGINQFGGDNPTYGSGIRFAIDPTVNSRGEPTNFTAERHPLVFGVSTEPANAVVDVTNYLRTDAAGRILPGEHFIYLLGTDLSVVSVVPLWKFKEAGGS